MLHSVRAVNSLYAIEVPKEYWDSNQAFLDWANIQSGLELITVPYEFADTIRNKSWSLNPSPDFWPHLLAPGAGRKPEHNPEYILPMLTPLARTPEGYVFDETRKGVLSIMMSLSRI